MNMKKDIYDDASLIKKSLLKDLSEEDRMKLEQLLEDRQLREVYDQLSDPTYLKSSLWSTRIIRVRKATWFLENEGDATDG